MKFGFDVHGVLDTHTEVYAAITTALVEAGHEVHVITGEVYNETLGSKLRESGVAWTHWFSIAEYHIRKGNVEVRWVNGEPWMDAGAWNCTKARYCREEGIRLLIDDSPVYGQYFGPSTIYLLQKDPRHPDFWENLANMLPKRASVPVEPK